MPQFKITIPIDVSDAEQELLCDTLRCEPDKLEAKIQQFAPAAVREYLDMFSGVGTITTVTEVRERRLVAMMLTAFAGTSPDADQIARLFSITPSAARTLLRSVAAKHRLKIRKQLDYALGKILNDATQLKKGDPYAVVIVNPVLVELLNARLAASPAPRTAVRPDGDGLTTYAIDEGSFNYLRGLYPK